MSKKSLLQKIELCPTLLQVQKNKVIDMVEEENTFDNAELLIDECLWKLFDVHLTGLTPEEQAVIKTVIREMGYDNS